MSNLNRTELKAFFETLDVPTQAQFASLIDSLLNSMDDGVCPWQKINVKYSDYQPSSATEGLFNAITIPAGHQLNRAIIMPNTPFTGGTINGAFVTLWSVNNDTLYEPSLVDVGQVRDVNTGMIVVPRFDMDFLLADKDATSYLQLELAVLNATDGINDLTAGSVDVFFRLDKISQLF